VLASLADSASVQKVKASMATTKLAEHQPGRESQTRRSLRCAIERSLDAGVAALAISFALPLFALIALLIVIGAPGPVFASTRQVRVDGRHFDLMRFRTQLVGSSRLQELSAQQGRRPSFGIGALLHHTGLEDIPMLINVARGDLPIIGHYTWQQVFNWLGHTD
jgi:lipopolysaccharide/colanic/teichoic acid biosynthesis glycosyltransferase